MKKISPKNQSTLIIFSWGAPARLGAQIDHLKDVPDKVVWIDPLSGIQQVPSLAKIVPTRIEAVIGAAKSEVGLQKYSLHDLYSVSPTNAALMSLMPGLKPGEQQDVPMMSYDDLARKLASLKGTFVVVIDTPGAEQAIFDCLEAGAVWGRIEQIMLRCGIEPFFEGAQGAQMLCATLESKGFVASQMNDDDPDWPEYMFQADPRARAIRTLERDLQTRTKERDIARTEVAKSAREKAALTADLAALSQASKQDRQVQGVLRAELKKLQAQTEEVALRAAHEKDQIRLDLRRAGQAQERLQAQSDALYARYTASCEELRALKHLLQQITPKLREAAKQVSSIPTQAMPSDLSALVNEVELPDTKNLQQGSSKKKKKS